MNYKEMSISALATVIRQDWKKVYFGAIPYLEAMQSLVSIKDNYGADEGKSIVAYFLCNASGYRGPVAKEIKVELNRRLKAKG